MKIVLSEIQYNKLLSLIFEDDLGHIDLNKPIDLGQIKGLEDLKTGVKTIGLQHGKESLSRKTAFELDTLLKSLEGYPDKKIFEDYFIVISKLISKYKKGSFSLKKLKDLIISMSFINPEIAKTQMQHVIDIFEDPRFEEGHKTKLIKLLTGTGKIDLQQFYNETERAYRDYEKSFSKGDKTPFIAYFTSPRVSIRLRNDYFYENVVIKSRTFNEQSSDVNKVLYVINEISKIKSFRTGEDLIKEIVSNLNFAIDFDYTETNVKADLKLKETLLYFDKAIMRTSNVGQVGMNAEIKKNKFNKPYYLSEFFKVDASDDKTLLIINSISKIPRIKDPKDGFKLFMYFLANNLRDVAVKGQGDKIIEHLTKDLVGMIFDNDIFILKKDINFYWNSEGYANKSRLSIFYQVNENADVFTIKRDDQGNFTRYLNKIKS